MSEIKDNNYSPVKEIKCSPNLSPCRQEERFNMLKEWMN